MELSQKSLIDSYKNIKRQDYCFPYSCAFKRIEKSFYMHQKWKEKESSDFQIISGLRRKCSMRCNLYAEISNLEGKGGSNVFMKKIKKLTCIMQNIECPFFIKNIAERKIHSCVLNKHNYDIYRILSGLDFSLPRG